MTEIRESNACFRTVLKRYTVCFVLFCSFCLLSYFVIGRKNMFDETDGIHQQYTYYLYVGIWIRRLFENFFVKHIFELPMWDMTLGMGSDSLIALNPLNDPIYWLSALVPKSMAEYAFSATMVIKLFLSGLAYSYFAFCKKNSIDGIVAGAMVYVLSAVILISMVQCTFINAFYFFPLLMVGVDRIWNKRGSILYVVILAACVMYSYYFTYMMGLMVVFYCIVRFCFDKDKRSISAFVRLLASFVLFSVIGIGIGLGAQLPAIINLSRLDRLGTHSIPELVSLPFAAELFLSAFSGMSMGGDSFWGFVPIAGVSVILLLAKGKSGRMLRTLLFISTLSFVMPIVGYAFNAFNSSTTRYVFGYLLLISYIVTYTYDAWDMMKGKVWIISLVSSIIYLVITIIAGEARYILSGVSLVCTIILVKISVSENGVMTKKRTLVKLTTVFLACMMTGYSFVYRHLFSGQFPLGEANDYLLSSNGLEMLDTIEGDLKQNRYDTLYYIYDEVRLNSSAINEVNGYDIYQSNYNNYVDRYYLNMAVISNPLGFALNGLRGRSMLELTNGTKYLIRQENDNKCINAPYNFDQVRTQGDYSLYISNVPTSMVYFYDMTASEEQFGAMTPVEREDLIMSYCVLEGAQTDYHSNEDDLYHDNVEYEVTDMYNVTFEDDEHFTVGEGEDGYIILEFDDISDSEVSIYFDRIDADLQFVLIPILCNGDEMVKADFFVSIPNSSMYYHWKDQLLFTFGYVEEPVNGIKILFHTPGDYSLHDLKVYSRSEEQISNALSDFSEHADINNVEYNCDGNHIMANVTADSDKMLYFAVPYSEGWHASVDGKETVIQRANIAFMAIPISEGEHTVELSYITPYLKTGICISSVSIIVFVSIILWGKRESKRRSQIVLINQESKQKV